MSRIGRMPITVPAGVTVNIAEGNVVTVKGPKGELTQSLRPEMIIKQEGTTITVERPSDDKLHRSVHGLTRTLLHNMVIGVTEGFKKELDVNGVGYRVAKDGKTPKDTRTGCQKKALEKYVKDFHRRFPDVRIVGHNELAAKACPSFDVQKWLKEIGINQ